MDPDMFVKKLNRALQFYVADYKKVQLAKPAQQVDPTQALNEKKPSTKR